MNNSKITKSITYKKFKEEVLNDYWTILIRREASLLGRKEVLSGKAKFGIFGDGKELPQVAMAKVFEKGLKARLPRLSLVSIPLLTQGS